MLPTKLPFPYFQGFFYSANFQENVKWIQTKSKELHQFVAFEVFFTNLNTLYVTSLRHEFN